MTNSSQFVQILNYVGREAREMDGEDEEGDLENTLVEEEKSMSNLVQVNFCQNLVSLLCRALFGHPVQ